MLVHDWVGAEAPVRGGVLAGVMVHPDARRRGLFSWLVQACEAEAWAQGAEFVLTMPNERSAPGFARLGWTNLGDRTILARPFLPGRHWGAGVREVEAVPDGIAALVDRHRSILPGLALARTADWWRWRFDPQSGREYVRVAVEGDSGEILAFAVGTVRLSKGLPVGYLVDYAVSAIEILSPLVAKLSALLARRGALLLVAVVSSPGSTAALKRAGFLMIPGRLPLKRFHTVAQFRERVGARPVLPKSIEGWNLSLGDWDNL
jgi:hypothetical protein